MAIHIRRREFIFTLGGAAAAWPLAARAQQTAMPVIGFLSMPIARAYAVRGRLPPGPERSRLRRGQNVAIEYRWADGQSDRLPALAADLVRRQVAVIVATGHPGGARGQGRDHDDSDRLHHRQRSGQAGLVASLNRPGGNVTGVTSFTVGAGGRSGWSCCTSWCPTATMLACSSIRPIPTAETRNREMLQAAAARLGLQIMFCNASTERDFDAAFATFVRTASRRARVGADPFFNSRQRDKSSRWRPATQCPRSTMSRVCRMPAA